MTNTKTSKNYIPLVLGILAILIVYFFVNMTVEQRVSELQLETKLLISEQQTLLATIAETTARNGADAITEQIIKDCSNAERARFDELLGTLDAGLSYPSLLELERLFGVCGDFFAQRKSVMVARLSREIEIYENYVRQLDNITNEDSAEKYNISQWQSLSDLEQKQNKLFSELVTKQKEIIDELLQGKTSSSPGIKAILQEVSEIQGTLLVTKKQTDTLRAELVSL